MSQLLHTVLQITVGFALTLVTVVSYLLPYLQAGDTQTGSQDNTVLEDL